MLTQMSMQAHSELHPVISTSPPNTFDEQSRAAVFNRRFSSVGIFCSIHHMIVNCFCKILFFLVSKLRDLPKRRPTFKVTLRPCVVSAPGLLSKKSVATICSHCQMEKDKLVSLFCIRLIWCVVWNRFITMSSFKRWEQLCDPKCLSISCIPDCVYVGLADLMG